MNSLKVSVIIPAYNNAEYLGEAVQSVLNQTYSNLEVIVVNDASPDDTFAVVSQFPDPRMKYIVHKQNQGLSAARNTGIRTSEGDIIALLDGDDIFHPNKLQLHIELLEKHPEIGVTYNARFELNHSANTIRELWRPPTSVTLADLVLGFPFSPSDMVLRREWAFRVNLFDERYTYFGEDLDINCRLALAGCKFASVDRALNYRRFHSRRIIKDLQANQESELSPLHIIFADPRLPVGVLALRDTALSNRYLGWTNTAYVQDDTALGQRYCLEAIRLNPAVLDGQLCPLVESLITFSILDESVNHEQLLRKMFDQLPSEVAWLKERATWAVGLGYLRRGTRAIMWGRVEDGRAHFARAKALDAEIDETFLRRLATELLSYKTEFGSEATRDVLRNLAPFLKKVGNPANVRWLMGCYSVNQAFQSYHAGEYVKVPKEVVSAIINDSRCLTNRGVIAILARSMFGAVKGKFQPQPDGRILNRPQKRPG